MTESTIPPRSAIPTEQTWNAPSVFENLQAWENEYRGVTDCLSSLSAYSGRVGESPDKLLEGLRAAEELIKRAGKLYLFASVAHNVDTTDQVADKMLGQAQSLYGQTMAATSFLQPELLSIGEAKLEIWMKKVPALVPYCHFFNNLLRKQAHVRSAEVEELLGMASDPFAGAMDTQMKLVDADFKFRPAHNSQGEEFPVTDNNLEKVLDEGDREARRTAWESYMDQFLAYKNTLAGLLTTSIRQNVFNMRARRHASTLEMALFEHNIPVEVFHNLIATFRKNLPTWHRYWALRRKILGVQELNPYDIWAPLSTLPHPQITYFEAIDLISQGIKPLGKEYVDVLRQGALRDRWVDYRPNLGKSSGAFSSGWYGTHPFIVLSYNNNISSLGTLAHELGHSMHSYLTWKNQPFTYSHYSMFVAEVASNFHQAMVRAHLFQAKTDPVFQIALIEEAMSNFHRYFFIMPTLARFELETHQRIERGEGLNADDMIGLMADLFSEAYGSQMHVDRQRVGITWATFGHLFIDYYVFQYATGISAAHAMANRILSGVPGAAEEYLNFLKAGSSVYPIEALKIGGVDMTTPEPVEEAFKTLSGMVDRLEALMS